MIPNLIALTHLTAVTRLPGIDDRLRVVAEVAADMAAARAATEGATTTEIAAAVAAGGGQPTPARPTRGPAQRALDVAP
ncbi:hypothetical protein [Nocardia asteroides]|uniref:hypothetical protein n=1 Tax=Nocardia asteroides TaxID=1824 RepID=UPI0033E45C19